MSKESTAYVIFSNQIRSTKTWTQIWSFW